MLNVVHVSSMYCGSSPSSFFYTGTKNCSQLLQEGDMQTLGISYKAIKFKCHSWNPTLAHKYTKQDLPRAPRFKHSIDNFKQMCPVEDTLLVMCPLSCDCKGARVRLISRLDSSSPSGSDGKESACRAGEPGSIPRWGRPPGEGDGNALQHSCLESPMTESLEGYIPWVTKSQTRLSN